MIIKNKKLLTFILICRLVTNNIVFAAWSAPDGETQAPAGMEGVATNVIAAIKWIAIVVAVIMVIYVGIKYLTAGAGSKASVKGDMLPMLIGAILIAGSATIVDAFMHV